MSETRLTIDPDSSQGLPRGRVDYEVLDATSEDDIARHAREDDAEAMRDRCVTRRASPAGCADVSG